MAATCFREGNSLFYQIFESIKSSTKEVHHDKKNSPYLPAFLGYFCHIRTPGSYWELPLTRALLLLIGDVFCWKGRSRFQKAQIGSKSPKPRRSSCLGTIRRESNSLSHRIWAGKPLTNLSNLLEK